MDKSPQYTTGHPPLFAQPGVCTWCSTSNTHSTNTLSVDKDPVTARVHKIYLCIVTNVPFIYVIYFINGGTRYCPKFIILKFFLLNKYRYHYSFVASASLYTRNQDKFMPEVPGKLAYVLHSVRNVELLNFDNCDSLSFDPLR